MNLFLASLQKEIREALRDRRALFLTLIMPLVFYPAMLGLTAWMQHDQIQKESLKTLAVGILDQSSSVALPESRGVKWVSVESLDQVSKFDVFLHFKVSNNEQLPVTLYYHDTARGDIAKARIEGVLSDLEGGMIAEKLKEMQIDSSIMKPLVIERINQASARQSAGSRYGGVGAYFLVFLSFTGCLSVAIDTGAGEKERGTLEAMLVTPASLLHVVAGKLLYIMIMGLLSVCATLAGIAGLVAIGTSIMGDTDVGFDILAVLSMVSLIFCVVAFFASLLLGLSLLARSSREAHMRGSLLLLVVAITLVYSTLPGIEYTLSLSFIPVLNIAMALRASIEGTLSLAQWGMTIGGMVVLTIISLAYTSYSIRNHPETALLKD